MYGYSTEEAFEQHMRDRDNGLLDRSDVITAPAPILGEKSRPLVTEDLEMMELMQALAQLTVGSKEDARSLFVECNQYEDLLRAKHVELEQGYPTFSSVIETWVTAELQNRPENRRDSNMEKAITYDRLKAEMYEDYEDVVARNPEAAAEWHTIEDIIDNRIRHHVLEDAKELLQQKFDLAA